jgi:hypothetical protein
VHYLVIAFVNPEGGVSVEQTVANDMAPYRNLYWDWCQIGGRWTGHFDGYNPELDPRNIEVCDLCNGTGKRPNMECENGCNGCQGKGKRVTWPTTWGAHAGDIVPVETVTDEKFSPYAVVCNWGWFAKQRFVPWHNGDAGAFEPQEMPPLDWLKKMYVGGFAVVVDIHN